ncbi:MAG: glycosyltransferase family 4 protein [Prevotella sp.]|nr:glycosyltransferase family 4 protein [Prevotella sp.]
MKIAILTSGILPVPAVQGGAVENLTDFYLAYNDAHHLHDITVYSIAHEAVRSHAAVKSASNHYYFIDTTSTLARIRKHLFRLLHKDTYYHFTIEYFLARALRHIRRQHYDIIIVENRPGYALRLSQCTKARIIHHLHNDTLNADTPHAEAIFGSAARILTVSRYIADRVRTIAPDTDKCTVVHNGIDLDAFSARHAGPSRAQAGISETDFVLVFSGRLTQEKGIVQLIEAMNLLHAAEHIKLLVLGSSFYGNASNDDPFVKHLKTVAEPLRERIVFTGFIPYGQVPSYLSLADVAVVPSQWNDPFPTSILEALAMGKPIITTDRGGIPEQVTPQCAVILPTGPQFAEQLASAILSLSQHRDRCQAMGQAALQLSRQYAKERFAQDFFSAIGH